MANVPYEIVGDTASWVHVRNQASSGVPFLFSRELLLPEVTAEFAVERRIGADDLYDPPGNFYKLNIDHVYITILQDITII